MAFSLRWDGFSAFFQELPSEDQFVCSIPHTSSPIDGYLIGQLIHSINYFPGCDLPYSPFG